MSRPNISYPQPIQPNAGPSTYQNPNPNQVQPQAAGTASGYASSITGRRSSAQSASSIALRQPSGPRPGPNALDSCITRLLVVTKQLLQGLEQWAQGYLSENDVSDIYVRLGDIFDTCITSFNRAGIATRELISIPQDLRRCLEEALAEEACQESLNLFLPTIRQIIYNLLDGLKRKQAQYKRSLAERQDSITYGASSSSGAAGAVGGLSAAGALAHSQSLGRLEGVPETSHPQAQVNPAGRQGSFGSVGNARPSIPQAQGQVQGLGYGFGPGAGGEDDRLSVSNRSAVSLNSVHSNHSSSNLAQPQQSSSQQPSRRASPSPASDSRIPSSALAERERERAQRAAQQAHRPAPPDAFRPPRRIPSDGTVIRPGAGPSPAPPPNAPLPSVPTITGSAASGPTGASGVVGSGAGAGAPSLGQKSSLRGVQLKDDGPVSSPSPSTGSFPLNVQQQGPPPPPKAAARESRYSYYRDRDSLGNPKPVSRFSADSDMTTLTNGSPIRSPPSKSPPATFGALAEHAEGEGEGEDIMIGEGDVDDGVLRSAGRMTFGQRIAGEGISGIPGLASSSEGQANGTGASAGSSGGRTVFDSGTDAPSLPKLDLPNVSLLDSSIDLSTSSRSKDPAGTSNNLELPPEAKSTLDTLRRFDNLERRASKRFSSYTMNKMLPSSPSRGNLAGAAGAGGGHSRKPSGLGLSGGAAGDSPQRPARRVERDRGKDGVPAMPALPESLSKGGEGERQVDGLPRSAPAGLGAADGISPSKSDMSTGSVKVLDTPPSARSRNVSLEDEDDDQPLAASAARRKGSDTSVSIGGTGLGSTQMRPSASRERNLEPVPESASTTGAGSRGSRGSIDVSSFPAPPSRPHQSSSIISRTENTYTPPPPSATHCTVYLQFGRQTKKAKLEYPITAAGIKMMFMERFEYDPGMDDFPEVYVLGNQRDKRGGVYSQNGVAFELEDMEDVVEGCVLSLNIEPLDQVKQHFDHTFASLIAEIKEMKSSLDRSRRISTVPSQAAALLSAGNIPPLPAGGPGASPVLRASPRLGAASPRLSPSAASANSNPLDAAGAAAASPAGPAGGRGLTAAHKIDLEAQQNEIHSLRRDLAIMRQLHSDFLSETKTAFTSLKTQNNAMKEVINTKTGGSRALLDNSKTKLENASSDTITAVEEVQDLIDAAKDDAQRRFAIPSNATMKKIRRDLAKAEEMAESYRTAVHSSEQMWRSTWAHELQRVMEEQKLYKYQTTLGEDLRNDVRDAKRVWASVEEFVSQRVAAGHVQVEGGSGSGTGTPRSGQAALRTKGLISQGINFRPPSPTEGAGMPHLLREIRSKESADPNQRLKAIEAQAKARERERAEKAKEENEFADELGDFVGKKKLKKTGGTEEVERMRMRKQEVVLRRMITGESGGSTPAGSRNVTPVPVKKEPVSAIAAGATGPSGASASAPVSAASATTTGVDVKQEPNDRPAKASASAPVSASIPTEVVEPGRMTTPSVQAIDPDNQPIKAEIDSPARPARFEAAGSEPGDEPAAGAGVGVGAGNTEAELRLQREHEEVFGSPKPKSTAAGAAVGKAQGVLSGDGDDVDIKAAGREGAEAHTPRDGDQVTPRAADKQPGESAEE